MKQIATGTLVRAAGKYAEHAPMATTCCNACRACVQTNLTAVGVGAAVAAGAALRRFAQRFARES
jgi:hypothetical protein